MSVHPLRQYSATQRAQLRWHRRPQAVRKQAAPTEPKSSRLQRVLDTLQRWHDGRVLWIVACVIVAAGDVYWTAIALGWKR